MGMLTVGSTSIGRYPLWGFIGSMLAQIPRIILPLPFVLAQLRFNTPAPVVALAVAFCLAAIAFAFPGLGLKIYTRPTHTEPLVTTGLFGIVRHPILFANILWPLGWSAVFGSWIGLALVPAWAFLVYLMSFLEEDRMIEVYGDEYRRYRKEVPRLFPFIKFL
jgi:protein-S-isoprenylcysteine O-methyltransferase Ste14